jgi:hypothetical protein
MFLIVIANPFAKKLINATSAYLEKMSTRKPVSTPFIQSLLGWTKVEMTQRPDQKSLAIIRTAARHLANFIALDKKVSPVCRKGNTTLSGPFVLPPLGPMPIPMCATPALRT